MTIVTTPTSRPPHRSSAPDRLTGLRLRADVRRDALVSVTVATLRGDGPRRAVPRPLERTQAMLARVRAGSAARRRHAARPFARVIRD